MNEKKGIRRESCLEIDALPLEELGVRVVPVRGRRAGRQLASRILAAAVIVPGLGAGYSCAVTSDSD